MSETYTKLFGSITRSTIWAEDDPTRLVWITMLAIADQHGYVGASIPGLASTARVSIEATEAALDKFLSPDRYSRSQEFEGRRIEVSDRGWTILNYERFRDMRDEEARKEYERNRKREARKRQRDASTIRRDVPDSPGMSLSVPTSLPRSAQAEAEAEAYTEVQKREKKLKTVSLSPAAHDPFNDAEITKRAGKFLERYQELYPEHRKGARYALKPHRDYAAAVTLCQTWTDEARLEKLAVLFLTTDHKFAEEGSRTVPQFLALASWCDGKLAEWEQKRRA